MSITAAVVAVAATVAEVAATVGGVIAAAGSAIAAGASAVAGAIGTAASAIGGAVSAGASALWGAAVEAGVMTTISTVTAVASGGMAIAQAVEGDLSGAAKTLSVGMSVAGATYAVGKYMDGIGSNIGTATKDTTGAADPYAVQTPSNYNTGSTTGTNTAPLAQAITPDFASQQPVSRPIPSSFGSNGSSGALSQPSFESSITPSFQMPTRTVSPETTAQPANSFMAPVTSQQPQPSTNTSSITSQQPPQSKDNGGIMSSIGNTLFGSGNSNTPSTGDKGIGDKGVGNNGVGDNGTGNNGTGGLLGGIGSFMNNNPSLVQMIGNGVSSMATANNQEDLQKQQQDFQNSQRTGAVVGSNMNLVHI